MPPRHFALLLSLSQQAKKGVAVFAGVVDPEYQPNTIQNCNEISLTLYNGGKKEYAWTTGDPLGHLLVLLCPVIRVNGKLKQPNSGSTTNGPDPSGMKVGVTPSGKKKNPMTC